MSYKSMNFFISFLVTLFVLSYNSTILYGQMGPSPSIPPAAAKNGNSPQLPPGMTEDELKMFSEFLESLDQETLDALSAIGEEIIKEADELGVDPWDYVQMQAQMQAEYEEKTAKEKGEKSQTAKPTVTIPTAEAQSAQEIFKAIAHVIPEIMQKAASDLTLSNDIQPFKYRLDDLVYYFTRLSSDTMLRYLADPSFQPLIETANELHKQFITLNDQFYVEEFSIEGENPYEILDISHSASQDDIVKAYDSLLKIADPSLIELQLIKEGKSDEYIKEKMAEAQARFQKINDAYDLLRSQEEAQFILSKILDAVSQAVDTKKILEQATKVLQLHDPEALKIKQEQEKVEIEARKAQDAFIKKRPISSRSFSMPMPKHKSSKKYDRDYDRDRGYTPFKADKSKKDQKLKPSKISTKSDKKVGGTPKGKDDKDKDKDKKDKGKDKKGTAKTTPAKGKDGKKDDKKPASSDVIKLVAVAENSLKLLKETIKKHREFLTNFSQFAVSSEAVSDNQKNSYITMIKDLFAAFQSFDRNVKSGLKKFSSKKEELKMFKDLVSEAIKKFEKSGKFKLIALLLSDTFAFDKPLLMKGSTQPMPLNSQKAALIFNTAPTQKDDEEEAPKPYIILIRETYKALKDKVMPKDATKSQTTSGATTTPLTPLKPFGQ